MEKFRGLFRRAKPSEAQSLAVDTRILLNSEKKAILQLERPVRQILKELRHEINAGHYGVVIGDDASGRLPALLLSNILKKVSAAKGNEPPLQRFIAGSSILKDGSEKYQAVAGQVTRIIKDANLLETGKKVLVVTDTLETGNSINPIMLALKNHNISAVPVAIGLESRGSYIPKTRLKEWDVSGIVYGMKGIPEIYKKNDISGVIKRPEDLFAQPMPLRDTTSQSRVNKAREVVEKMAEKLASEFLSGH